MEFALLILYVDGGGEGHDYGAWAAEEYGIERLFLEEIRGGPEKGRAELAGKLELGGRGKFGYRIECRRFPSAGLRQEAIHLVEAVAEHMEHDRRKHSNVHTRSLSDEEYSAWKRLKRESSASSDDEHLPDDEHRDDEEDDEGGEE